MSEPLLSPMLFELAPARLTGPSAARLVGNVVLFQSAWFACVLGAAHESAWLGILAIAVASACHLALSVSYRLELRLILAAMLVGALWESALVSLGLLHYPHGGLVAGLAPPWIVAMWALLATTLNVSMRWLKRRWAVAALLGAISGPLSFLGGQALGAASFTAGTTTTMVLAVGWACLMPLMMWLSNRYDGVVPAAEVSQHG